MKKSEAEPACRELFSRWAKVKGLPPRPAEQPSFSEFTSWAESQGFGHYLRFRSVRGAREDVEDWFDRYFGQSWRN